MALFGRKKPEPLSTKPDPVIRDRYRNVEDGEATARALELVATELEDRMGESGYVSAYGLRLRARWLREG